MVDDSTRNRIVFALVTKDGQLNKELLKNAKTNHNSLSIVLTKLMKDKIIEKKEDRYYLSTQLENTSLKALGSAFSVMKSLEHFGDMLEVSTDPFKHAIPKISEIIRLQMVLKIERFSAPKLTKRDLLEFETYFEILDAALRWIFVILRKESKTKTNMLRIEFIRSMKTKK